MGCWVDLGMINRITLLLLIGLALGQSKMDINNLIDRGGVLYATNDNKPFSGSIFEFYENGTEKLNGRYRNGIKNGKWTWWNEDGGTNSTGSYKNGLQNGIWKYYYSNGKINFEGKFEQGLETGKHMHYYESGQMEKIGLYKFGNKEGDWIFYTADGILKRTITYKLNVVAKVDGEKVEQPEKSDGS